MKVMSLKKQEYHWWRVYAFIEKLTRPKDTVNLVLGIKPGKISNIKPGWNSESDLNYQTRCPLECLMEGVIYKIF